MCRVNSINLTRKRYYSTAKAVENNSKILTDFIKEKNLKPVYCYEALHLESTKKRYK